VYLTSAVPLIYQSWGLFTGAALCRAGRQCECTGRAVEFACIGLLLTATFDITAPCPYSHWSALVGEHILCCSHTANRPAQS